MEPPAESRSPELRAWRFTERWARRELGARTFLRGIEYVRRGVVELIELGDARAVGRVTGHAGELFEVHVGFAGPELRFGCTCPAYAPPVACKHIAALLMAARDRADTVAAERRACRGVAFAP